MILDARALEKPAGVLVDHGTGKRVPFARRIDFETGEYEHFVPAPNGLDVLCDEYERPIVRKAKAVGRLELVPIGDARVIGDLKPRRVVALCQPMGKDEKIAGVEQYKRVYVQVWNELRGESRRCVDARWMDYLTKSEFLDCFVIRRRPVHVQSNFGGAA